MQGSRGADLRGAGAAELQAQRIDGQVLGFLDQNWPGATVAVTKNGRVVWSKGYGYADYATETPMQPWHRSRIGSVSKLVTALAVLQLVEDGTLGLDQPIYGDPGPFQDLDRLADRTEEGALIMPQPDQGRPPR